MLKNLNLTSVEMKRLENIPALKKVFEFFLNHKKLENIGELVLEKLISLDFIKSFLSVELLNLANSDLNIIGDRSVVPILHYENFNLVIREISEGSISQSNNLAGNLSSISLVRVGGSCLSLTRYRENLDSKEPFLKKPATLKKIKTALVKKNEILSFKPLHETFCFHNCEGISYLLIFSTLPLHLFLWIYDRETREPLYLRSSKLKDDKLRFSCEVLKRIGNQESVRALKGLIYNENHSVRWEAYKAISTLDFNNALKYLEKATSDKNIQVAEAAKKTLQRIGG